MTVINPKSISGITSITTPSGADDLLTIHTNDTTERFRVDGSGNTRITSGIVTTVSVGAITGDISIDDKIIHTGDTNTAIRFPTADTVSIETGGTERLRVDSGGRLLIGVTASTPTDNDANNVALQVEGTDGNDSRAMIRTNNTTASNGAFLYLVRSKGTSLASKTSVALNDSLGGLVFNGADGSDDTRAASIQAFCDGTPGTDDMPGRLAFYTTADGDANYTERLRINSVGKVGINSTAPDGMLAIEHTSSAPNLTMRNHPAAGPYTNEYGLELRHAYGTVKHGALIHTQEAADGRRSLDVSDSNGIFATFTNGKVGIGSEIPTQKLDVNGLIKITGSGGQGLNIENSGGTNAACINLKNTLSSYVKEYRIAVAGSDGAYATASSLFVRDQTSGANRFEIQSGGDVKVTTGDIYFGTAGKGIVLGATSNTDANTLDDYEEGTWTPAVQFDVGSPTVTYGTRAGTYVKIGRMVHLQYYMHVSGGVDVNDYFARLTLPFTGISVGHQDARVRQWNTKFSEWFLSLGGAGPVFFMTNAAGSGVNYARGDDVDNVYLSGQYTLYV